MKTKHLLAALVVLETAIIGLLLAGRYQITFTPPPFPASSGRKTRRDPSKKSLRRAPKVPPRISSN